MDQELEMRKRALHGQEGSFDHFGCRFKGTWDRIVGSSNFLYSNNIIPLNSFRFKAGCGTRIRFWKDIWIGDSPLCSRYNRLFRLEVEKDCFIIDRIDNGQWRWNWSRSDLGVRNSAYLRDLLIDISQVELSTVGDVCIWSVANDGKFSVKEARNIIDDYILPSFAVATSWDKSIARKNWYVSWHAPKSKKHRFYVIFASTLWWLWRFRNSVVFCSHHVRKSDIIDNIQFCAFSWLHHRGCMVCNWTDWLMSPLSLASAGGLRC
ncbi:hypothetical protein Tco_1266389 [Tanacetum coccineum]